MRETVGFFLGETTTHEMPRLAAQATDRRIRFWKSAAPTSLRLGLTTPEPSTIIGSFTETAARNGYWRLHLKEGFPANNN